MTKESPNSMENKPLRFKNDRKAPRFGKKEFIHHVISKELYSKWIENNEQHKSMSYRDFLNVWDKITGEIYNQIVTNPDGVRLPYHNGDLQLNYVIGNKKIINHGLSNILGKHTGFLNWNTDKKNARVVWSVDFARKRNKWIKIYGSEIDRKLNKIVFGALQTHPEIFKTSRITKANAIVSLKLKKNV
jgi:hypothetical protein